MRTSTVSVTARALATSLRGNRDVYPAPNLVWTQDERLVGGILRSHSSGDGFGTVGATQRAV